MDLTSTHFPELFYGGGFTRCDGTIEFYSRVNSLVNSSTILLDYGAGDGKTVLNDVCEYRKNLRDFRKRVRTVFGADVSDAIFENEIIDTPLKIEADGKIPLLSDSVDIVVSDFVFEHISDPTQVIGEIERVLKPGGILCVRTPNKWSYFGVIVSSLNNSKIYDRFLKASQPEQKTKRQISNAVHAQ